MKRKLAVVMAATMMLGMLSACGSDAKEESAVSEGAAETVEAEKEVEAEAAPEGGEGEVLTIMINGTASDAYVEGYQTVIDNFNASNEWGVIVEADYVGNSDYKTKLTTMMASDSQPDIIFTWELGYLQNFVDGGKIVNLQPYLDADPEWLATFNKGTLEQETYDGSVYGIPTAQCMAVMYYNKAIFEANNLSVPTTYEEYINVCETLVANGVTPVALAATAEDAWLVSQYIQQLSNGLAGADLFESIKVGTGKWNDPAMVEAGKLFQEQVNAGYFEEGFTGVSGSEALALFQNGQAAMYFNGTWEISNLEDPEKCAVAADVSCFSMPASKAEYDKVSVGSLDNSFAVTTNCKNVDAAVGLLKFWTNQDNAANLLYGYGRMPATKLELDESKLSSLCKEAIYCFNEQNALTPWFDRMDTDLGNEFNNTGIAVANMDDPQEMFDTLQAYAESAQ